MPPQLLHLLALLQQLLAAQVGFPGDKGFEEVAHGWRKGASSAKRGKTELREAGCCCCCWIEMQDGSLCQAKKLFSHPPTGHQAKLS